MQIINSSQNWFVASLESTIAGDGCLMQWMTAASSSYWWSGVWGTNTNELNIWFNYKGLSLKPNGDTTISGNLESQRLTINKPSNDDDIPLQIINNNQNWVVASLESTISGDGCLMQWVTPASSTYWRSGVWGTNTNE